jgi:signal transduction histidine kinase
MTASAATVLVVDHDADHCQRLVAQLEHAGHQAFAAADETQARQVLADQRADLALLDMSLPASSGPAVLRVLRGDARLSRMPIIALVGAGQHERGVRCLALGAADYLTKPCDPLLLQARVNAALAAARLRSAETEAVQLRQQSQFKAAMIGKITHELRSPFAAAGLSLQLLRRYAEHGMHAELAQQIELLDGQLSEGRRMIDGVIAFATFVGKRAELRPQLTDIDALVTGTVQPLLRFARSRRVALECDIAPDLPLVAVDAGQLAEAVQHLVHNAIKFNREGGRARVACHVSDGYLVFAVEDTGVGVDPETLPAIWEAFAQSGDDIRRGVEGLGLGLALVRYVVEAHGGEVRARSAPGKGSVFGFRIPLS